jgi:type IX secretion system PorP/SprF family membrane protein
LINVTNVNLNYSYRVAFDAQHTIAFGFNINFLQNKIATQGLSAAELADPALISNKFDASLLTNGIGISYRLNDLSVDIGVPLLFSYQENKALQVIYSNFAYDFFLSGNSWELQPSVLVKYSNSGPFQADINLVADWNSNVWGQLTYRTNKNIVFAAGVYVKTIGIGYAYEINLSPMSNVSSNSHEIVLKFDTQLSVSKKKTLYMDSKKRNRY